LLKGGKGGEGELQVGVREGVTGMGCFVWERLDHGVWGVERSLKKMLV